MLRLAGNGARRVECIAGMVLVMSPTEVVAHMGLHTSWLMKVLSLRNVCRFVNLAQLLIILQYLESSLGGHGRPLRSLAYAESPPATCQFFSSAGQFRTTVSGFNSVSIDSISRNRWPSPLTAN